MLQQQLYPKLVYAPFIGLLLWPVGSSAINPIATGILEQSSKVAFDPIFVGKSSDERYIGSHLSVTSNDVEATAATKGKFESLNNLMVYAGFLCMSGGFIDGPFRYRFYPEMLEQRGMRYVHSLGGRTRWPGWTTFLDSGWSALMAQVGESSSLYMGQKFQGRLANLSALRAFWAGT